MLRSLYTGVAGLKSHQIDLDVIANNIANVNTPGFKASRVLFAELLNQTLKEAQAPAENRGGINPSQVGMGVGVAGIDLLMGQGPIQPTGIPSDLAILGEGFFALQDYRGATVLTRNGAFQLDAQGYFVHRGSGYRLMGWKVDTSGKVDRGAPPKALQLDLGARAPRATTKVVYEGNLDANVQTGETSRVAPSVIVYDQLGRAHELTLGFTRGSGNEWTVTVKYDGVDAGGSPFTITFDQNGQLTTGAQLSVQVDTGGGNTQTIQLDLTRLTQYAQADTVYASSQDGSSGGELEAVVVDPEGNVIGQYSNNERYVLGQLALATVVNPAGLSKEPGSVFRTTANSGSVHWGTAGSANVGQIEAQALEMSNVDLAQEFANMIVAQRGFQANTRVITTTDDVLQEIVNLRR
ncbi:MAG TPA: flagellar hook protein FlgE [Firmicutes bacterium]|nr:flagellar hook protein FlgE [Bacillota bacterium]